jgi:hypothetical protein
VSGKRRLPIVSSPGTADADEPERATWQWVAFGAGAIFTAWLPLSATALALASRLARSSDMRDETQLARAGIGIAALYALAIALGAFGGGFVLGRWAGGAAGARQAAAAGFVAAFGATALSFASIGVDARTLLVFAVAIPMSALGGALGRTLRTH